MQRFALHLLGNPFVVRFYASAFMIMLMGIYFQKKVVQIFTGILDYAIQFIALLRMTNQMTE